MGAIYEAVQEPFGRRVAVKTIQSGGRPVPPALPRPVPPRAGRAGPAAPQPHRADPRGRPGRGPPVLRHALHRGRDARPPDRLAAELRRPHTPNATRPRSRDLAERIGRTRSTPAGPRRRSLPRTRPSPRVPEAGGRPERAAAGPALDPYLRSVAKVMADAADALHHAHSGRGPPSRPEALEPDGRHAGALLGPRLRPGPRQNGRGRGARRLGRCPRRGRPRSPDGRSGRHGAVHGPRAVRGPRRRPHRCLGTGRDPLRAADAPPGLRRSPPDPRDDPPRPRQLVANLPPDLEAICLEGAPQGPRPALPDGRRPRRRPPPLAPPRADAGQARAPLRRVALWARRNKGWAAAIALGLAAILGLGAGGSPSPGSSRSVRPRPWPSHRPPGRGS